MIWGPNAKGDYIVRTTYHLCQEAGNVDTTFTHNHAWNTIWNLDVQPKVKDFVWRACTSSLPMRMRLRDKGVDFPSLCMVCDCEGENVWHALINCYRSRRCFELEG